LFTSTSLEIGFVALFGASFFVGIWYAFPMVNTVTDVWALGGGVLRALEAHSLLPGSDVSYGVVSFYLNYLFTLPALGIGWMLSGFDIAALKTAFIFHPEYSLIVPRLTSVFAALMLLVVMYRFLKVHVTSAWWRVALLVLACGNVLAILLARSGKMWMLSVLLVVLSFIFLTRALSEEAPRGMPGRLSALSILTAFLATANALFTAVFLVTIPVLLYAFRRNTRALVRIVWMSFGGAFACFVFLALNAHNTLDLLSGFLAPLFGGASGALHELSFVEAFFINARHAVEAFPLLLIALVPALFAGIRNKPLAFLALLYGALYLVAISVVFRSDHGLALNVRHVFPIGFFLLFLITAYASPRRWIAAFLFSIGLGIYGYTVFLLSVPATYNAAADFIALNYGMRDIRIDEGVFEFTLPMNKASYRLFADEHCGSTCQYRQTLNTDIALRPLVVTGETNPAVLDLLPPPTLAVVEHAIPACTPLARFGNDVPDDGIFDIDINLGRMVIPSFYTLRQLGKNIYLYDAASCLPLKSGLF